jgi:hypothetical protein
VSATPTPRPEERACSDFLRINICTRPPVEFKCRPVVKGGGRFDSYNEISSLRLGFILICREFPIWLCLLYPVIGDRNPTFLLFRCYKPPTFGKVRLLARGVSSHAPQSYHELYAVNAVINKTLTEANELARRHVDRDPKLDRNAEVSSATVEVISVQIWPAWPGLRSLERDVEA